MWVHVQTAAERAVQWSVMMARWCTVIVLSVEVRLWGILLSLVQSTHETADSSPSTRGRYAFVREVFESRPTGRTFLEPLPIQCEQHFFLSMSAQWQRWYLNGAEWQCGLHFGMWRMDAAVHPTSSCDFLVNESTSAAAGCYEPPAHNVFESFFQAS